MRKRDENKRGREQRARGQRVLRRLLFLVLEIFFLLILATM